MKTWKLGLMAAFFFSSFSAQASRFRNAYVSFELPPSWACKLEGSEYVCESSFSTKTKDAIIILTAKEAGPDDNLPAYLRYLNTPRQLPNSRKSQVMNVKERMLGKQMWIDGLHLGSETGAYFTRYLATVKDKISIVVSFSAHKQHFTKYSNDFIRAVDSLEVTATSDTLGRRMEQTSIDFGRKGSEIVGPPITETIEEAPWDRPKPQRSSILFWMAVILMAVGVVLYLRSSKKKPVVKKKDAEKKDPEKK